MIYFLNWCCCVAHNLVFINCKHKYKGEKNVEIKDLTIFNQRYQWSISKCELLWQYMWILLYTHIFGYIFLCVFMYSQKLKPNCNLQGGLQTQLLFGVILGWCPLGVWIFTVQLPYISL